MSPLLVALVLAQPAAPKLFPPDEATAAKIAALRVDLEDRLGKLATAPHRADVAVYAKAAEWTVRHNEWHGKDSAAQTARVLEAGIGRAKELAAGKTPWREVVGKPVILGFVSDVDGSVQPVAVTKPVGGPANPDWVCDVMLHGRDNTLTEVKFIARAESGKVTNPKRTIIEPFGRGNNAYRWAGETDVFEAVAAAGSPDPKRTVLRGFSMGGAGTWHLGLHHPLRWAAIQPGAGFTTTRGYAKLPDTVPDYVEKCLTIYDADRYAANIANVPTVAYSGANDKQKAAADGVERALAGFPEKLRFTHVVAPGLEHKQPPEWVAKCDAELAKHLPRKESGRFQFVTYTPRYGDARLVQIKALEKQYQMARVVVEPGPGRLTVTTSNVRQLDLWEAATVDGQRLAGPLPMFGAAPYERVGGRWQPRRVGGDKTELKKVADQCGPIDDAFMDHFTVHPPTTPGWHPATDRLAADTFDRFDREWDRYFRGRLRRAETDNGRSVVLFGDPASNPLIAKYLPRLPIRWTKDELEVDDVRYDPATHLPVLIYPKEPHGYVVLNSGHTFGEKEFQGSNALLYPRLGDWAVRKVTGEIVAAGLFDENWQFPK